MGSELCKTCIHTKVCMKDKNLVGDVPVMGHPMFFDNDKLYEEYKERERQGFPCEDYMPTAEPEIIRCKECIYYDPEHIENNGIRYEYKDMPKEAFDELGTGLVNIEYGINVGGRCCRDYNRGYSEDKRVFVPETNYCGRAERRTDE